jgi:hypothetical protein
MSLEFDALLSLYHPGGANGGFCSFGCIPWRASSVCETVVLRALQNYRYMRSAMPVSLHIPIAGPRRLFAGIFLLFLAFVAPALASGPAPPLRIPLDPLGFEPLSTQFLLNGSSMMTLHYVDEHHLLLTFTVRRLLHRLPNDPVDDQDRNVDALLLELPTGHILARTSWRLHDHGQYLWNLGQGHFLLRVRDTLTTFAPLVNLSTGEPFRERPFLSSAGRSIAALLLSPNANFLIVETIERAPPVAPPKTPIFGPAPPPPAESEEPGHVQINFYRIASSGEGSEEVKPLSAGVVRANGVGNIASTTAGYLAVIDEGHQHWAFDFNSFTGKTNELSPFDSTCRPSPFFVSRSQFIAFGCHGGSERQLIGGFDMRGQEMWEQNLFGEYISPSFDFAPSSGRFALSRVLIHSSTVPDQPLSTDELSGQNIIVYQAGSGRQLLHAECSPVERAGQNFALSPAGLGLALVHADSIEIYSLPPLTSKDEADVKLAETSAPEESNVPVHFAEPAHSTPADTGAESANQSSGSSGSSGTADASSDAATQGSDPATAASAPGQAPDATSAGDPAPGQHRKPPTLYNLPTDAPQNSTDDQPKQDDQPK